MSESPENIVLDESQPFTLKWQDTADPSEVLTIVFSREPRAIVLTVTYNQTLILKHEGSRYLQESLIQAYDKARAADPQPAPTSCVVVVESPRPGSSFSRALFKLWKKVNGLDGDVYCAKYPPNQIDYLIALGLPRLPRFYLASTKEEALTRLSGAGAL
jgi:hypothetical protein